MKLEFSRKIFENYSNIRFHENLSSGSRVVPCGRTVGRTIDKVKSRFSQFCEKRLKTSNTTASSGHKSTVSLSERGNRVRQQCQPCSSHCCIICLQDRQLLDMVHIQEQNKIPLWRLSKSSFLSNNPQFPIRHYLMEGSQALPFCPSRNRTL